MHSNFKAYREDLPLSVKLPELDYSYEDVSSVMMTDMLVFHYKVLHQGYIDRYNKGQSTMKVHSVSRHPTAENEKALLFNLGGYLNHSLFWKSFTPDKKAHAPSSALEVLIKKSFQKDLCEEIVSLIPRIRGSGWIWLTYSKRTDLLNLCITMNQDFPEEPVLINIDLWEHSFMPQYKTAKDAYVVSLYSIINWQFASERLEAILNE